jgi:hypothetical protein
MDGEGGIILNKKLTYFFSRLFFINFEGREAVIATIPKTEQISMPPKLAIPYANVLDKFKKHFEIITPEEYNKYIGKSRPVGPQMMIN